MTAEPFLSAKKPVLSTDTVIDIPVETLSYTVLSMLIN